MGVALSGSEESSLLAKLATVSGVAVFAKGYEPPVGDLLDFFQRLRAAIGAGASIRVVPVGLEGPLDESEIDVWRSALAQVDDGALYVDRWLGESLT